MTVYIIKSIICSGILLMFYQLLLKREKMHHFNRFYLIGSIAFSLLVPLMSIELPEQQVIQESFLPEFQNAKPSVLSEQKPDRIPVESAAKNFDPKGVIIAAYALISLVLLIRFAKNISIIFRKKSGMPVLDYHQAKLVLVPEDVVTYTFLKYIFVNEKAFRNGQVETEILTHELAHVKQKHTLDILFIELVNIVFWINPVLLFYRNAIRLNHEFLADNAVLNQFQNVKSYQLLLLDKVLHTRQISLTSSFNYSITKNRLEMMKTTRNLNRQMIKLFSICLLLAGAVLVFSEKTYSQTKSDSKDKKQVKAVPTKVMPDINSTGSGLSPEELAGFNQTLKANSTTVKTPKGATYLKPELSVEEKKRMYVLYKKMTKEQQDASEVTFFQMPIPVKSYPTAQMYENWKDPNTFGVWIDDKKVSNKELVQYTASDIAEYWSSKLYGAAKKGRIYKYQLDLTTNAKFDRTYKSRVDDRITWTSRLKTDTVKQ
jgi:bla regulator protein BlaR1